MIFNLFKRKKGEQKTQDLTQDEKGLSHPETIEGQTSATKQEPDSLSPDVEKEENDATDSIAPEQTKETRKEKIREKESGHGLFSRLKSGLSKTRDVLTTDINALFTSAKAIDEDLFEELEELLITSDLGMDITMDMMDRIRKKARRLSSAEELKQVLKDELIALFPQPPEDEPGRIEPKPRVIMMVGVNGTGKTTTLGKLAMKYTRQGKKVLIAAADTFRAAAIEQVEIWANRANASLVKHREGADPAAVAYDALEASMARGIDILLIDTAGRLHTQKNLMEELKKIQRTVSKKMNGAPHDVLMVLDATTGQNAVSQAKIFNEAVGLSQIALTKLDGTAKGGIVASISKSMDLPIRYIGVGESIDDLQDFDAKLFIHALFED